jgi:tyrosine-protein phosphatase SIW14
MNSSVGSAELRHGKRRTLRRLAFGLLVLAVGAGGYFAFWHAQLKRFQAVREGVLYRSGQPSEFGLNYLVKHRGLRTVLSLQLYDFRLYRGWFDPGRPDGERESEFVARLGARPVQWAMGEEKSWPWLTPWQFEEFFRLFDDPANLPVVVHCQGGRHRTGTISALFRLEYDRWPVERALDEMYSFKFGGAIRLQEHNLRTYLPRPRPNADEWQALVDYWQPRLGGETIADYDALVRRLKSAREQQSIEQSLLEYLARSKPFALPLAQRLIERIDDPLAEAAATAASEQFNRSGGAASSWSSAAALIADFGSPAEQEKLLGLLADRDLAKTESKRFDAIAAGVMNRYTPNRAAFLLPLLEQESYHLADGAKHCRYCDTAVARLSSIIDVNLPATKPAFGIDAWDIGRQAARDWFAAHPAERQLTRLRPPTGHTIVHAGDPMQREDLSKANMDSTRQ